MQTYEQIAPLRAALSQARKAGQAIGLVPTMGAFHEGHLTLLRRACAENDRVVVTLFVNPTQFNQAEDFEKYPRDPERDRRLAEAEGVDYLLEPTPDEMYPAGYDTVVTVPGLSQRLEGESRPGHFQGVSTVVTKLLNIVQPDRAYFGEKDWQQLQVIRRMAADLNMAAEIIGVPIVREPDGLAMSSRNARLTPAQRSAATILFRALADAEALADAGVRDAAQLAAALHMPLAAEPLARVDYAVVVDPRTMQKIETTENGALAAVAATFGSVRLIDNRYLFSVGRPSA